MESLGDILKRLTPSGTSRNIQNGEEDPSEAREASAGCSICGGAGWVSRRAPVGHPDFGQVFSCRCHTQKEDFSRQLQLKKFSGLPLSLLKSMSFASFDVAGNGSDAEQSESLGRALSAATNFANQPDGWLLLTGTTGSGKTHLAIAVAAKRIREGELVLFAFVPDLLDHLRATLRPNTAVTYGDLFEQVKSVPLLILDDLGAESGTAWAQEKLHQIIVHRHNFRLPTVITTCLMMEQIEGAQPRLASRLKDIRIVNWVAIGAPDYRDSQGSPARPNHRSRKSK